MSKATNLQTIQTELSALAGPVRAATVAIGRDHRASGFVVEEGLIVTNAHAVRDRTVLVTFADGRTTQGTVKGVDHGGDLAVIAVDTAGVVPIAWSESTPEPGHLVVSGHGSAGIALGMVGQQTSSFRGPKGRIVTDAFEHGTTLNRGASGGPVLNLDGKLVGINTARTHGGYRAVVASDTVRARITSLAEGKNVDRPSLGIAIVEPAVATRVRTAAGLPARNGVLISAVAENSPAARAGLSQGDLIVSIDAHPITSVDDVHRALDPSPATVTIVALRGEAERTVTVTFASEAA